MNVERAVRLRLSSCLLIAMCLPLAAAQGAPLKTEITPMWQKWLDEDVRWIITDQERAEFKSLATDKQRDQFVEAFWQRRNPNPGASENTFKEEHYRRIAYANRHFAAVIPGWKTDRGRIYIMYGAPDKVDQHFSAAGSESKTIVGPGPIPYDWELWHYSYLEGLGKEVNFKFADTCACGEYRIPIEKDDLRKYAPR
jgi:GWxTD domain-containing protein